MTIRLHRQDMMTGGRRDRKTGAEDLLDSMTCLQKVDKEGRGCWWWEMDSSKARSYVPLVFISLRSLQCCCVEVAFSTWAVRGQKLCTIKLTRGPTPATHRRFPSRIGRWAISDVRKWSATALLH